jgi:lipid-binding SYLF domain-containing protein
MRPHAPATAPRFWTTLGAIVFGAAILVTPVKADEQSRLTEEVNETIAKFTKTDASLRDELSRAAGYAVFPGVGKGAMGIGGAHGTGQVIVGGKPIGKATLTQVTIGLQLGGQKYAELILFEDQHAVDRFVGGAFTMAAQVSAVALASGAAANAKYANGVKVITATIGGLMYEASVGGQKFNFDRYK